MSGVRNTRIRGSSRMAARETEEELSPEEIAALEGGGTTNEYPEIPYRYLRTPFVSIITDNRGNNFPCGSRSFTDSLEGLWRVAEEVTQVYHSIGLEQESSVWEYESAYIFGPPSDEGVRRILWRYHRTTDNHLFRPSSLLKLIGRYTTPDGFEILDQEDGVSIEDLIEARAL